LDLRDDVRAFLDEKRFGVLATVNSDGSPQQSVMWYEPRGDIIMMNTLRGRKKDRNLQRDARASLCVEDGYRYVTMEGTITVVDDPAVAQADIAALAIRNHGAEEWERTGRDVFGRQERLTLLLSIERIDVHGFDGEE
jgi:PPOX class probable F420-dependent enzyme